MEDQLRRPGVPGAGHAPRPAPLDAERSGRREYDEVVDGHRPSLRRRWPGTSSGRARGGRPSRPNPAPPWTLRWVWVAASRPSSSASCTGQIGGRWRRCSMPRSATTLRFPDTSSYPSALANAVLTALIDEATFRGILLGFLLADRLEPWVAVVLQAVVYALATAPGPGSGAAHAGPVAGLRPDRRLADDRHRRHRRGIHRPRHTRFSVVPRHRTCRPGPASGTEVEEVWRRRVVPDGWASHRRRESREAASRDR